MEYEISNGQSINDLENSKEISELEKSNEDKSGGNSKFASFSNMNLKSTNNLGGANKKSTKSGTTKNSSKMIFKIDKQLTQPEFMDFQNEF